MRKILRFFDKLEDKIRVHLSRYPILYALIGGTAIVLFWRGVWETASAFAIFLPPDYWWLDGPISLGVSIVILLATGLFVSFFITDRIILSGLKREKKMAEKTESEVRQESDILKEIKLEVEHLEKQVEKITNH
jgi:hypothetical protein